jgi:hypothetical protein
MIQAGGDPSSVRALWILIGAVVGAVVVPGVVGWVSSLYNHYRDSRKLHLEELRQDVLEPSRSAALAPTLLPAFEVAWGPQAYNTNVGVSELLGSKCHLRERARYLKVTRTAVVAFNPRVAL